MGREIIKSTCLHLHLYYLFSVAKSAVATPGRKFCFASFVEHFEAVPCLLFANCSLPFHPHFFEYLNYFEFRGLEGEVERITVGGSTNIYDVFSFPLQMSHSFLRLFPSGNRSSDFVTSPEFPFLKQWKDFYSPLFSI
jgi:hypothetical protein